MAWCMLRVQLSVWHALWPGAAPSADLECIICHESVKGAKMRHNIAAHIAGSKGISADQFPCGACGAIGLQCMPGLKKMQKKFVPDVVCSNGYYVQ